MKKHFCLLGMAYLIVIITISTTCSQTNTNILTKEDKLEDFNKLYDVFKENYIYFEINRRQHNVDWLGNYEKYKEIVLETSDDLEFYKALEEILNDLHQGHTFVMSPQNHDYYLKVYTDLAKIDDDIYKIYNTWVNELKKENVTSNLDYWIEITKPKKTTTKKEEEKEIEVPSNIFFEEHPERSTAIVGIRSFGYQYIEKDADTINSIFSSLDDYNNLIIDIQGNTGGSTDYVFKNIIMNLIDQDYYLDFTLVFRNTPFVKHYFPMIFDGSTDKLPDRPNLPPELHEWNVLVNTQKFPIIKPDDLEVEFKGDIYLLVDTCVYSAAETFAVFCKQTGFATIAGTRTGGDGIGRDPVLFSLPNSGLVIGFPVFMGLNPDGSANEEKKTTPDILLDGKTPDERRNQLLLHISNL